VEDPEVQGWKGLRLKLRQGLDSDGKFYQQLISQVGLSVGVANDEPYLERIPGAVAFFGLTLAAGVGLWCAIGWWGYKQFWVKIVRLIR
jgi:hypothetical protein